MSLRRKPNDTDIIASYNISNLSLTQFSESLGVSRQAISRVLKRFNIQIKPVDPNLPSALIGPCTSFVPAESSDLYYWWDTKEWFEEQYVNNGRSVSALASEVGSSEDTISKRLRKHGFKLRSAWESTKLATDNDEGRRVRSEASKKIWANHGYKIKSTLKARSGSLPYQQKDWLSSEHVTKTADEIAKNFDVSRQTIHYWLNKFDIPLRGHDYREIASKLSKRMQQHWAKNYDKLSYRSKDQRDRIAKSMRQYYSHEPNREAMRERASKSIQHKWATDDEYRDKCLTALSKIPRPDPQLYKEMWQNENFRSKMIAIFQSDESRAKHSENSIKLWQDESYREKVTKATVDKLQDPIIRMKMINSLKEYYSCPQKRAEIGERSKITWQKPSYRSIMASIRSNQPRISNLQKTLYRYLSDLDVEYSEEGPDTTIGHYVWDCLVRPENGKPILIDCQGEYWHSLPGSSAKDKSKFTYTNTYFPEFDVMYLWEREFKTVDRIRNKLISKIGLSNIIVQFDFSELRIKEVDSTDVREFLDAYHYLNKGRGGISYGAYYNDIMVACVVYSPPLRQNIANQFQIESKKLRELSRLCIHPDYQQKNLASWFIARTMQQLQDTDIVVSYADTTAGHSGTIYKAANFQMHHYVDPDYWYVDKDGFVMHKRTLYGQASKNKLTEREYAEKHGFIKKWGGPKLCYIYDRRNRSARKSV